MKQATTAGTTHRSLERGLLLLEAIASYGGASLAEAARRTGLHRSTAHHLLQTLVALGYLHQDAISRGYRIGARPFRLTGQTWTPEQLAEIGEPILVELTRASGEGTSLAVYREGAVRVVAKREPEGPVRVVQNLGAQRPLHATAVAKAILPWLAESERASLLKTMRFERFTPKTIVSRRAFEAELGRIRSQGHALDDEEHQAGIRCIAMPLFGSADQILGSLCIVGPKSRMSLQRLRALREPLAARSQKLSLLLGREPGP